MVKFMRLTENHLTKGFENKLGTKKRIKKNKRTSNKFKISSIIQFYS